MRSLRTDCLASLLIPAILLPTSPAVAWGPEGHNVVATIAESLLSDHVRTRVHEILQSGESLAAVSSWADQVRSAHRETAPWHYVDIPINRPGLDMARDCADGNCVIARLEAFARVLSSRNASANDRREALMFLVHFVGDMHQPLHCSDNNDEGGNKLQTMFFGQPVNMHRVWDSALLERMDPEEKLTPDLQEAITAGNIADWSKGSVADWANESHSVAQDVVYGKIPGGIPAEGHAAELGEAYAAAATPVVQIQLEKAGVRLAAVLNRALK